MDTPEARHKAVEIKVTAAYATVTTVLLGMPIPIALPPAIGGRAYRVEKACQHALELLADMPLSSYLRSAAREMLLDWMAAFDVLVEHAEALQEGAFETWRLDFAEVQVTRVMAAGDHLIAELQAQGDG